MPCYSPLRAFRSAVVNESGKRGLVFDKRKSLTGIGLSIPCGKCVGCRHDYARQWAIRCMHEKQLYHESSFITLTYADEHLPADMSLRKRDLQLFMKRLRKHDGDTGIRFYACGEYGDANGRPHYHILLFNRDFMDKKFLKNSGSGEPLFRSKTLSELWPDGDHYIGTVSAKSCAYVARYVLKKVGAEAITDGREPEFTCMSRRPGIGAKWFEKYHKGVYDWDTVVFGSYETRPPRYYDARFDAEEPERMQILKRRRKRLAFLNKADNTKARLRVREVVQLRKDAFFSKRG